MTAAISIASVLSIAICVALLVYVGAWPLVAIGAFGVLVFAAALGFLRWDGAP